MSRMWITYLGMKVYLTCRETNCELRIRSGFSRPMDDWMREREKILLHTIGKYLMLMCVWHAWSHLVFIITYELGTTSSILQKEKLRLGEVKQPSHSSDWDQSQGLNPSLSVAKALTFYICQLKKGLAVCTVWMLPQFFFSVARVWSKFQLWTTMVW